MNAGVLYGALRRSHDVDEMEEMEETVLEDQVVETVQEKLAQAARDLGLAQRVKNAVLAIDAGRNVDLEFDLEKPDHVLARDWVATLDDTGIRALRHMPMPALSRHLDRTDRFRGAGLPVFPVVVDASPRTLVEGIRAQVRFQEVDEVERRQALC